MFARQWASRTIAVGLLIFSVSAFAVSPGDTVRTTVATKVMSGSDEITQAAPGTTFQVEEVNNDWLLGRFALDSKRVLGWVRVRDVEKVATGKSTRGISDDRSSEKLLARQPEQRSLGTALRFAVSDDKTIFAFESSDSLGTIQVIDLSSGELKWKIRTEDSRTVEAIGFSPSGDLIGARTDQHVYAWRFGSDVPEQILAQDISKTRFSMFGEIVLCDDRIAVVDDGANEPVQIWSLDGQLLADYRTSSRTPIASLFNQEGSALVTFYSDEVQYWQENTDPKVLSGQVIEEVHSDRSHRLAAIRTPKGVLIWRLDSLKTTDNIKSDKISAITMSADGRILFAARGNDSRVEVSRINSEGQLEYANTLEHFTFHEDLHSQPLVATPDGSKAIFGSTYYDRNPSVLVADTQGKAWEALRMLMEEPGESVAPAEVLDITADAATVAVKRENGHVSLYDTKSNYPVWTHHIDDINHLTLDPTGNTLLAVRERGECLLFRPLDWAIAAKKVDLRGDGRDCRLKSLQFNPEGSKFAALTDRRGSQIAIVGASRGQVESTASYNANAFQFTSDGQRLFLMGGSGAAHYHLANRSLQPLNDYRFGATFHEGERAMVGWITRNGDRKQALYDPRTGAGFSQIRTREASTNGVKATSLDGTLIAFVGRRLDGQGYALEVIDVATGETKHAFPLDVSSYTAVRFTPDARHLLLATNRAVVRIDYRKRQFDVIADGSRLASFATKPDQSSQENPKTTGSVASAAALGARSEVADGTWIKASGASLDSDASDSDPIRSMDISNNGWMFTGHRSGTVNLWNGYTGEHVRSIHSPPDPIEVLAASPDGSRIACAPSKSGIVYLLDLSRVLPPLSPTSPAAEPESTEEPGLSLEIK